MLRANKTLQSLNLESNFVTGAGVQALVDALRDNDTVTEIKIDNQVTCMEMCAFSLVCIKQNNPGRVSGMVEIKTHYFLIFYEPKWKNIFLKVTSIIFLYNLEAAAGHLCRDGDS